MVTRNDEKRPDVPLEDTASQNESAEPDPQVIDDEDLMADPNERSNDPDAQADEEPTPEGGETAGRAGRPHDPQMDGEEVDGIVLERGNASLEDESSDESEPDTDEPKKKKKGKKGSDRRKPSEKEIFQRFMEKNEVILQLNKKNIQLEASIKALADRRVQLMAEFENYRKRTRKEWELLKDQTKAEVIAEILNVVDDFERALAVAGDQDDEFVQGIRLIYNNLLTTLEKLGVRKLIALGEPFDPSFHMAVAHIDSESVESDHVVEVISEGYLMDGTVVRPANVVIAK